MAPRAAASNFSHYLQFYFECHSLLSLGHSPALLVQLVLHEPSSVEEEDQMNEEAYEEDSDCSSDDDSSSNSSDDQETLGLLIMLFQCQ